MKGLIEFSAASHLWAVKEEKIDKRKTQDYVNNKKLEGFVKDLDIFDRCLSLRTKQTGSCLTVRGTTVTGTVLLAM